MMGDTTHIPFWVLLLCHIAMGLGTAFGGGSCKPWGCGSPSSSLWAALLPKPGATTLAINSVAGIPVSTTHVITGAIVGVGATMKLSSVRWGIAGRILWAWVLTIPAAAGVAIAMWYVLFALGMAQH